MRFQGRVIHQHSRRWRVIDLMERERGIGWWAVPELARGLDLPHGMIRTLLKDTMADWPSILVRDRELYHLTQEGKRLAQEIRQAKIESAGRVRHQPPITENGVLQAIRLIVREELQALFGQSVGRHVK